MNKSDFRRGWVAVVRTVVLNVRASPSMQVKADFFPQQQPVAEATSDARHAWFRAI